MKNLKKIMAVLIAAALVFAMGITAFGATITINRDSTWDDDAENANATYTYYKIFDAAITEAATINEDDGSIDEAGTAVYTISGDNAAAKVAALPNIFKADLASDGKYYITLADSSTTAAQIVSALTTLVTDHSDLFPAGTPVTSDADPVTITVPSDAYYLILASNGKNAVVQTIGDVTINEKNDYPTVDKKQKQENGEEYKDAVEPTEIGQYIDYQITVHIPEDATKQIAVIDKMSTGLEYDSTTALTVTPDVAYSALTSTDVGYDANATWQIKFADTVVQANRGQDIVITFRAKVTAAALTDTGKENEVTLNYDNGNYVLKDDVDYEVYFAGIYKVDPKDDDANMAGVKFDLKDGDGNAVKVTFDSTNGYYVVDPNGASNKVETREDGDYYTIKIRGLDNDKTYTLTETDTVAGYNLLAGPVTLTKIKDEGTAFADKALNTFDKVENNKGTTLPSTGGIGTTIFYIIGGVIVLAAVIILVVRSKKSSAK